MQGQRQNAREGIWRGQKILHKQSFQEQASPAVLIAVLPFPFALLRSSGGRGRVGLTQSQSY